MQPIKRFQKCFQMLMNAPVSADKLAPSTLTVKTQWGHSAVHASRDSNPRLQTQTHVKVVIYGL